jgi:hypothetical protein
MNGILTPGMVPDSVPREVRHEIIRGRVQAVEHFKAEDVGIGHRGRRGYSIYHGWDDGPSPRELGNRNRADEKKSQSEDVSETAKDSGETAGEESNSSQNLSLSRDGPSAEEPTAASEEEEEDVPAVATTAGS